MKTILTILITFTLIGCNFETEQNNRIQYKTDYYYRPALYIVEVDSVEYLVNYKGGIIKLN